METIKDKFTKTKSKKKKVKAVHQKVKVFRANDPKMAVLMWGVTHSVSQLSHVPAPVMLLKDDFKAYGKIKIDNHYYNKENMPGHFKFKEYMPLVFRNLRERFHIEERSYAQSFLIQPSLSTARGNSGAKFLLTINKRFYVKTIEREEVEMMHHIMPNYHRFIVESHSETLLPQYLGMYRTTIENKEYYYLVLRNVFSDKKRIHKKYDLKGSRIDREAKDSEKDKQNATFKDNDFTNENAKIYIGKVTKTRLQEKLHKDINFLSSLNIMDYSLLVGIHDTEHVDSGGSADEQDGDEDMETGEESGDGLEEPPSPDEVEGRPDFRRTESITSNDGYDSELFAIPCSEEQMHSIYYMGIIDVLTYYGATKKAAHAAKTVKHGVLNNIRRRSTSEPGTKLGLENFNKAGAEISTVKPQLYATRFLEFIDSAIE